MANAGTYGCCDWKKVVCNSCVNSKNRRYLMPTNPGAKVKLVKFLGQSSRKDEASDSFHSTVKYLQTMICFASLRSGY